MAQRKEAAMRIGIVGTENSHVDHIIGHLNAAPASTAARVVALAGGDTERNRALAEEGGIASIVDSVDELLPLTDALIVTDRDGALHREHSLPFLTAGRPVLVDKPLACNVQDAHAIVDAARRHDALLTSFSMLRFVPDVTELVDCLPSLGPLRSVVTSGPADPDSAYGGIFFYGIHPVDVALSLVPGTLGAVRVDRVAESIVASTTISETRVTVTFVRPLDHDSQVPFHALGVGRSGIEAREIRTIGNYVSYGLTVFLDMVATGTPPIPYDDLLRPIEFLEAIQEAL
jgi:predicted dehydrogenase